MEDLATVEVLGSDQVIFVVRLHSGCEGEETFADAVFGVVVGEIVAEVFDEVAVHGAVAGGVDGDVEVVLVGVHGGLAGVLGEMGVGDVAVLDEEAAVELEELLVGAGLGRGDAGVGDFFAMDGLAFAGGDAGVLEVDEVGALGLGAVLVGGDAGHDGFGGGQGLGRGAERDEEEEQEAAHSSIYAKRGLEVRCARIVE